LYPVFRGNDGLLRDDELGWMAASFFYLI
jgi:hypothetical protein